MSARPTFYTTTAVRSRTPRIRRLAAVVSGAAIAAVSLSGVAAASTPTFVAGNPNCADIQGTASWKELKIESPGQGTSRLGGGGQSAVVTASGAYFDFTATPGVDAVIVKGGPNANVYRYSPEATSGDDLHAPINPSNGKPYGLSHISFCYDTEPPPTDPCEGNPGGTKPNGDPCTPPTDPCEGNPGGTKPNGDPCTP
ncbi:MAG TPA: hypothetical protein VGW10_08240, partial [Solirubrobacteraceae bacterium]|nr:hypothetical protein [Solirubrobacteraceae bacterium]